MKNEKSTDNRKEVCEREREREREHHAKLLAFLLCVILIRAIYLSIIGYVQILWFYHLFIIHGVFSNARMSSSLSIPTKAFSHASASSALGLLLGSTFKQLAISLQNATGCRPDKSSMIFSVSVVDWMTSFWFFTKLP